MQSLRLVEEPQCEVSYVASVRNVGIATPRQPRDRGPAEGSRIVGPVGRVVAADGVEHDSLAQGPVADGDAVEVERVEDAPEERRAGGEQLRPPRFLESWEATALLVAHVADTLKPMLTSALMAVSRG